MFHVSLILPYFFVDYRACYARSVEMTGIFMCVCVNHLHVSVNIVNKMFSSFSVSVYTFHCDKHRVSIPRGELIQKNV